MHCADCARTPIAIRWRPVLILVLRFCRQFYHLASRNQFRMRLLRHGRARTAGKPLVRGVRPTPLARLRARARAPVPVVVVQLS